MELSGKLVIVTGASRGIGRALATELAKSGCNLLLTALEADELSSLANELRSKFPPGITTKGGDLSDPESRRNLINWILNSKEPPDILINNAGLGYFGRFEDSNWNRIEKTIVLNISALIHLTYAINKSFSWMDAIDDCLRILKGFKNKRTSKGGIFRKG